MNDSHDPTADAPGSPARALVPADPQAEARESFPALLDALADTVSE